MEMTAPGVMSQAEMSGAEITMRCLQEEGVEFVFGYPGGAILPIYDEMFKQDKVKHILVRHEQAAVHGADGYARSTEKVGVVMVTSGPGLTNAVTGIATAYMDSIPLVIISGQVPTPAIGLDAFQEVDTVGITRPCVKHNFLVKDVKDLAITIKKAFYIARTGRPGTGAGGHPQGRAAAQDPVPLSGADQPALLQPGGERPRRPDQEGHPAPAAGQAPDDLHRRRRHPGGRLPAELTELVRALGFPCTNTLMGLGGYPATDPLFLGMLGMHGTYEANMAMQHCDVLLAVGARFDDRVIGNPKHFNQEQRQIIHIDVDPSSISKRVKVDIPIVGDVKDVLQEMNRQLAAVRERPDPEAVKAWWAQIELWKGRDCLKYDRASSIIKPQMVIEKLYEVTKGDLYLTSDVGQHQMWAAQFYKFDKPRRWLNSGGLGTMGVGLPYALGAKLAHPEADVACVTGEASILMCIQELSTAKQYRLPVKVVNLNNRYMGMVRQWQEYFHGNRYSESYMDALPDFVKLAESFGHVGMRIEKPADIEPALREAFGRKDDLVFMDFVTDQTENVFPMVPAGKGLSEMILV